jgi:hypothetical protein
MWEQCTYDTLQPLQIPSMVCCPDSDRSPGVWPCGKPSNQTEIINPKLRNKSCPLLYFGSFWTVRIAIPALAQELLADMFFLRIGLWSQQSTMTAFEQNNSRAPSTANKRPPTTEAASHVITTFHVHPWRNWNWQPRMVLADCCMSRRRVGDTTIMAMG